MVDPFAMAAAALFRGPGSVAAVYVTPDAQQLPVRAICSTSPVDMIVGSRTIEAGATVIQLQCSDFAAVDFQPVQGGTLLIGEEVWTINARPRLDVERVSWTCEAADD